MLFPTRFHEPIRRGELTVAFRRWKRPTVAEGGTLQSPAGLLHIDELTVISEEDITDEDATAAGFMNRAEVLATVDAGARAGARAAGSAGDRTLYRIRFRRVGGDAREALRADTDLGDSDLAAIDAQLGRWDAASTTGPWTATLLDLIAARPAEPSRLLSPAVGMDQAVFKRRVRQLKGLGLTESLETGYRLSPRGEAYLPQARERRASGT